MARLSDKQAALLTEYADLVVNTGGNDPVELCNRRGVTVQNNLVVALLQSSVDGQAMLLEQLDTAGLLVKKGANAKAWANLLLECRDALPAISITAARLYNVSLTLADRIEAALEPYCIKE